MVNTFELFFNEMFEHTHAHLCDRTRHLLRFARFDTRMEGWLQGELLYLFLDLIEAGKPWELLEINKTDSTSRNRPDFSLRVNGKAFALETKVLSGRRGLRSILNRDVPKLRRSGVAGALLLLAYGLDFIENRLDDLAAWDRLAADLRGKSGLTCLRFEPVKVAAFGVLSLWQARS